MLAPGTVLDGYRLLRLVGRGGFGEVWLCESQSLGDFHALKFIAGNRAEIFEKEFHALVRYRKVAAQLRSTHIMPIEHINRNADGIFYSMPLADGFGATSPAEENWQPNTLAACIESKRAAGRDWFSRNEILNTMAPILDALQMLADNGLVHRDVKPENILFFAGKPCLADISLLGEDKTLLTRCGTPGYLTPSWYLGGHADMFGAAMTLFEFLTGNNPDKFARANYRWPPRGQASLPPAQQREWERMHRVVQRALEENLSERFSDFRAFKKSLLNQTTPVPAAKKSSAPRIAITAGCVAIASIAGFFAFQKFSEKNKTPPATADINTRNPEKNLLSVSGYADVLQAAKNNTAEFNRHITAIIATGEKISGRSAMLLLAEKIRAERAKIGKTDYSPATPNAIVSSLELALFRLNEQILAQAKTRATTPAEREFFEKNILPALRREAGFSLPAIPQAPEFSKGDLEKWFRARQIESSG